MYCFDSCELALSDAYFGFQVEEHQASCVGAMPQCLANSLGVAGIKVHKSMTYGSLSALSEIGYVREEITQRFNKSSR